MFIGGRYLSYIKKTNNRTKLGTLKNKERKNMSLREAS